MSDDLRALEEADGADALRAIDDLVRDDVVAGLDFFSEGADGGEGDYHAYTEGLESGDVGSYGDG